MHCDMLKIHDDVAIVEKLNFDPFFECLHGTERIENREFCFRGTQKHAPFKNRCENKSRIKIGAKVSPNN